ncbi:MAG: hydrogenase expression/formation protein HypE [Lentisphaeria bacterium]|nr:hydrogenase expression/formation protein HypE [Lentisphaeria bacterium]
MELPEKILLSQGGGGAASAALIEAEIVSRFAREGVLAGLPDAAALPEGVIFSTDSFVVTPRFFPGGNVGKLAVCGTVNDILVSGGIPKYLSLALVLEEGFSRKELGEILDSVKEMAESEGVQIATGDTKVVPSGAVDGIFLNTAGIGFVRPGIRLGREYLTAGDKIIVSGGIGDHGMAILSARHGISGVESDCASLRKFADEAFQIAGEGVKLMRDPTRGGTGAVLTELLKGTSFGAELEEAAIPVSEKTRTLCKMTGIDPLFVPCEGRMVAIVSSEFADEIVKSWKTLPGGELASVIGTLNSDAEEIVLCGEWGGKRKLILPEGDPLPRIC